MSAPDPAAAPRIPPWTVAWRLAPVFRPYWASLAGAACAGLATQFAGTALLATAAWLIARAAQQPAIDVLLLAIVGVRGLALARGTFRYLERLAGHDAAMRALAELRGRVYAQLVARGRGAPRPAAAGGGENDSDLFTSLVSDVDAVQETMLRCLLPALAAALVACGATALTWSFAPTSAIVLAGFSVLVGVVLPVLAAWASRRRARESADARAELAGCSLDLLRGAEDLAASGAHADYARRAAEVSARVARLDRRAGARAAALNGATVAVCGAGVVAVLGAGLLSGAIAEGGTVLAAVLAFTALATMETAAPLVESGRVLATSWPGLARVAALLDPEVASPPSRAPEGMAAGEHTGGGSELRLRAVSVDRGGRRVLEGVSLRLPPGRKVAVVGASGAGKSTLLRLVAGEVLADSGDVTLGGVPATPESLRARARGMTEDAHVFDTTLRANLTLADPDATPEGLREAARAARLLDWVETLPDGWDTEAGEGGGDLSGGQRRRLLLARAFLAAPEILVLDEPTEGLDTETADALVGEVLAREGTVLLVTHRLAGLEAADEVLVLDRGRVVQRGRAEELRAVPGPYADLAARECPFRPAGIC